MEGGTVATDGDVLFEYRPARLGPMTVALVFILGLATPFAVADRLLAGQPGQALASVAPLALLLLFGVVSSPSPLRIRTDAVEVSRSRFARWAGKRTRFPLVEIENIYPSFYEDAGMRFSPFASAEGTAKHAGLRIEAVGGERLVVSFTPTVLNLRKHGTPPYHAALEALRQACARAGRPLVTKPPTLSKEALDAMLIKAATPLLPFPLTVGGIFAPALIIPVLGFVLNRVWGPLPPEGVLLVALVGLSPLLYVFALVNIRSSTRANILHEVQKFREHARESGSSKTAAR